MNNIAKSISIVLLAFLIGCNNGTTSDGNQEQSVASSINKESSQTAQQSTDEPNPTETENPQEYQEGVRLELSGVDDNLASIFQDNFEIVVKRHADMIYRKSDDIRRMSEAFFQDRPDLSNAVLTYDAKDNVAYFVYQYNPKPDDLDVNSNPNFMIVRIGSYFYITNAISDYFRKCKIALAELGIGFDMPQFYVVFLVDSNYYLGMYRSSEFQLQLDVMLPHLEKPAVVMGSLPTARMTLGVVKPQNTISGAQSNQQTLIDFFGS